MAGTTAGDDLAGEENEASRSQFVSEEMPCDLVTVIEALNPADSDDGPLAAEWVLNPRALLHHLTLVFNDLMSHCDGWAKSTEPDPNDEDATNIRFEFRVKPEDIDSEWFFVTSFLSSWARLSAFEIWGMMEPNAPLKVDTIKAAMRAMHTAARTNDWWEFTSLIQEFKTGLFRMTDWIACREALESSGIKLLAREDSAEFAAFLESLDVGLIRSRMTIYRLSEKYLNMRIRLTRGNWELFEQLLTAGEHGIPRRKLAFLLQTSEHAVSQRKNALKAQLVPLDIDIPGDEFRLEKRT